MMIAYLFPPLGGSGALRPLKIAKHLPLHGWTPIVLTVRNPDWYYARDSALLRELSAEVIIENSCMLKAAWIYKAFNPFRVGRMDKIIKEYLMHPDEAIGWLPFAYFKALQLAKRYDIKAVYSTSGPLTSHLIAYSLNRRTGIPWVADFRDEWFEDPALTMPTRIHRRLHYALESRIVRKADRIIAMAPAFNALLKKHDLNHDKFSTLYGGYDLDDIVGDVKEARKHRQAGRLIITFTGLFYSTFKPNVLIQTINDLIESGQIERGTITLRFVGANRLEDLDVDDKYGICEMTGFVPRTESIQYMLGSDLLLLLLSRQRGRDVIPSKLFEYMASGVPILALVPQNGSAAEMIRRSETGYVVDYEDREGTKNTLLALYRQWRSHRCIEYTPNDDEVRKYDQRILMDELARILDEMTLSH